MTEQEAEVLVARLTRIWLPPEHTLEIENEDRFVFKGSFYDHTLKQKITIYISKSEGKMFYSLAWYGAELYFSEGLDDNQITQRQWAGEEFQAAFATQWMDFFRRGCWLSGAPIEASAHEKAEWMQGFSREEIESWNLKL